MTQRINKPGWVFATATVSIRLPRDEVFAFVCNPLNDPLWNPKVVKVEKLTAGSIGVGTAFRQAAAFVGGRIESEWRITEYEPSLLFRGVSVRGIFDFDGGYQLETDGQTTNIVKYANFNLSSILPPFVLLTLAGMLLSKEFESSFDRLKAILDARV